MAGEWREVQFDQLCDVSRGASPRPIHEWVAETGIPWVKISDASSAGSRYIEKTGECIRAQGRSKSVSVYPGDLILSNSATPGIPMFLGIEACIHDGWLLLRNFRDLDKLFAYYLLLHERPALVEQGSGSIFTNLKTEILKKHRVRLPPLPEQRAIADILGTLDDKIELNRRMSETLEAMARALFKSWFVDFAPVRAKAEGRDPGLPKPLADLFPSRLVDSELGKIPEGWEVGSFGSITSQRTERAGPREVVVLSAVAGGTLARSDDHFTKRVYSKETNRYLLVEQWDFAYNPSRINIGSIGMLEEDLVGGVSPVYVVARPLAAYRWFLEFSLRRTQTKTWINALASGSVRQSLTYYDFSSIPSVIPPEQLAEEFNKRWSVLRDGISARGAESHTLAALRDALLPKLISGEVRVPRGAPRG